MFKFTKYSLGMANVITGIIFIMIGIILAQYTYLIYNIFMIIGIIGLIIGITLCNLKDKEDENMGRKPKTPQPQ